jgi:hypothetical protein
MDNVIPVQKGTAREVLAAKVRRAASESGVGPDDPLHAIIEAVADVAGTLPEVAQRIEAAAERAGNPLTEYQIERLAHSLATGSRNAVAQLVSATIWRTILIAAAVLVGSNVLTGAGVYFWLSDYLTEAVQAINQRLSASSARHWRMLMEANPGDLIDREYNRCSAQPGGGTACNYLLWTEPPPPREANR